MEVTLVDSEDKWIGKAGGEAGIAERLVSLNCPCYRHSHSAAPLVPTLAPGQAGTFGVYTLLKNIIDCLFFQKKKTSPFPNRDIAAP